MQDVYRIADKMVAPRRGRRVAALTEDETSPEEILAYMTSARE